MSLILCLIFYKTHNKAHLRKLYVGAFTDLETVFRFAPLNKQGLGFFFHFATISDIYIYFYSLAVKLF